MSWIDISVPIKSGMVRWPDNPSVKIELMRSMRRGDSCNVSTLSMGSHTGTHIDAPVHFVRSGLSIHEMPLARTIGLARVIGIKDRTSIRVEELRRFKIKRGERVLFKTWNSTHVWKKNKFTKDAVYISLEAAKALARIGVQTVGIDSLSVGSVIQGGLEIHQTLLSKGIWIIEGLNLSKAGPGQYQLICLPIKLFGGDGAPARAVLQELSKKKNLL